MILVNLNQVMKYDIKKPFHFCVKQHDFIVVQGENGSGKSTLFKLIIGLSQPDDGQVESFIKQIAYLPEQMKLPFFMNGITYLALQQKIKKSVIEPKLLHLFDVPLFRHVHELSKGNQQKLGLISTLMGNPELLILDEPLSGLDDESTNHLLDYLKYLKDRGSTIMVASHQPHLFHHLQTKVIRL